METGNNEGNTFTFDMSSFLADAQPLRQHEDVEDKIITLMHRALDAIS